MLQGMLFEISSIVTQMAFILGVGRKTAGQPRGRFAANFGVFIQA